MTLHHSEPYPFPIGSQSPLCHSEYETIIIDHEVEEHLELPIWSNVFVRVKASKGNPKAHFRFRDGTAEVSDIRRAYFVPMKQGVHLTLFTFMQPT